MTRYVTPEMEILGLGKDNVIVTTSNETGPQPLGGIDDPQADIDSRDYDPDYARSLGYLR